MNTIAVSVIIPVYNVEEYLEECLDSVLCQSLENIEIICIDGASTDNSLCILKRYKEKQENICIICHEQNKGLSAARNSGLKAAKGEYIFFLDSDDMLAESTVLEELYLESKKKNLDIVYCNYVKQYADGMKKIGIDEKEISKELHTGSTLFCHNCTKHRLDLVAWRQFCHRGFLLQNNLLFYEGIWHEDMLFSFLCAMKAERVVETEKVYYIYRQRENSAMKIKDRRRAQSLYIVLSEIYAYWVSHEFTEKENQAIQYYFNILYGAYKKYRRYDMGDYPLECGTFAEKQVYHLLQNEVRPLFNAEQIKRIALAEHVIVYGAGDIAEETIEVLHRLGVSIKSIAVTDRKKNPLEVMGIEVREITELREYITNAIVIVAVSEKFVYEICTYLQEQGFGNVLIVPKRIYV